MTRPEFLALIGAILVVSLIGSTMPLFRRPPVAAAEPVAASAATSRPYRFCGLDGRTQELPYERLPTGLGRWTYATQTDPSFFFAFDLEQVGNVVRIYIAEQPAYGSRSDDLVSTHRHVDGDRRYICIMDAKQPVDGREAATWLIYWSEATATYILTGRRFS